MLHNSGEMAGYRVTTRGSGQAFPPGLRLNGVTFSSAPVWPVPDLRDNR